VTPRPADERGAMVVETLAVMLLSVAALMVLIQMSLWLWARNVTLNAADEGARAAAEMGQPLATGEFRTRSVLHDGLGNAAQGFQVVATQDGDRVTVHARGVAPRIVPFLPAFTVSADAEAFDEDQVLP
jgi:Flp pilus assembly protein TadG